MTTATRSELKKLLYEFVQSEGIDSGEFNTYIRVGGTKEDIDEVITVLEPVEFIAGAFGWDMIEPGFDWWLGVNYRWVDSDNRSICDEIIKNDPTIVSDPQIKLAKQVLYNFLESKSVDIRRFEMLALHSPVHNNIDCIVGNLNPIEYIESVLPTNKHLSTDIDWEAINNMWQQSDAMRRCKVICNYQDECVLFQDSGKNFGQHNIILCPEEEVNNG